MAGKMNLDFKALSEQLKNIQVDDINNIDWKNMGSWPAPGKVFFCVLIFVVVFVAGYFYFVTEDIDVLDQAKITEADLRTNFESKAFSVSNLDAYRTQLEEMEETFGALLKQLPRDTEVPGLIDDISAAALNAGLSLNVMDPQRITQTQFYNELPLNIDVVGGYHELAAFVSTVASLPRIVTLHDFSMSKTGKEGQLKMNILAKTYQYNPERAGVKK
ncbi:MAG: hypothetical protein RL217_1721 [Pseudomonadota bacterium]|jgi:type IV pilus assembly protein PilO